ncbi:unnamed protein product [Prunus brigantina]
MKHKGGQCNKKKYMSLCEKSMVLVANIIKLSSLSLANNSFGQRRPSDHVSLLMIVK